jgi:transcriptional regulator with XRE-family HTH domain
MALSFSDLLYEKRLEQGWSQEQMARKIKTTRMTIYRWESGLSMPSPAFWQRLSILLDYQVETFFTCDDATCEAITNTTVSLEEAPGQTQILLEQQQVLAEQRLAFHRNYLQYVRDFVEILLPSLAPNASQNLRLRLIEYLFCQIEQTQLEIDKEFIPLSFSHVKDILELVNQENAQTVDAKEFPVDNHRGGFYNDLLRIERLRHGWTQKNVADLINVPDVGTVGRWERGISHPRPYYCRELCRIFGKTAEELGFLSMNY